MVVMSKGVPIEFRNDVVAVACKGAAHLAQIGKGLWDLGFVPAPLASSS